MLRFDSIVMFAIAACLVGVGDLALAGPGWVWLIAGLFMLPATTRILREAWEERPHTDHALRAISTDADLERLRGLNPAPYVRPDTRGESA